MLKRRCFQRKKKCLIRLILTIHIGIEENTDNKCGNQSGEEVTTLDVDVMVVVLILVEIGEVIGVVVEVIVAETVVVAAVVETVVVETVAATHTIDFMMM